MIGQAADLWPDVSESRVGGAGAIPARRHVAGTVRLLLNMATLLFAPQPLAYFYCVINYTRKRQHSGQHGSCCTRNRAILIRSVAMEWGLCRWARALRSPRPEVGRYRGGA